MGGGNGFEAILIANSGPAVILYGSSLKKSFYQEEEEGKGKKKLKLHKHSKAHKKLTKRSLQNKFLEKVLQWRK